MLPACRLEDTDGAGRYASQGRCALPHLTSFLLGQEVFDRIAVMRLEPGVEEIRDAGGDHAVAVFQSIEKPLQHRLPPRLLTHHHLEEKVTGERLAGPTQDLEGQTTQGVDRDAQHRGAARPHDPGPQMLPQAARGHHDAQRPREPCGVAPHLLGMALDLREQRRLGSPRPARDPHLGLAHGLHGTANLYAGAVTRAVTHRRAGRKPPAAGRSRG
jgi:hypothetical protein